MIVYLDLTLLFILIVLANFYVHILVVPLLSVIITTLIVYFFWRRERETERLKQEFVTVVTHKFRTPMTGIRWATEMLHNDVTFQKKEDYLKEIERATERIRAIIDLLTGFATFDTQYQKAFEFVHLRQLVDNILPKYAEFIRQKQLTFNNQSGTDVPAILSDKSKLEFVLDVLLDNAIKYTPAGGTITVGLRREKQTVTLSVADTGIGLRAADLRRVGERFWRGAEAKTVDTEGMGLGLYTARAIVRRLGGRLWAESPGLGQGATFFVRLKIAGYNFKFK